MGRSVAGAETHHKTNSYNLPRMVSLTHLKKPKQLKPLPNKNLIEGGSQQLNGMKVQSARTLKVHQSLIAKMSLATLSPLNWQSLRSADPQEGCLKSIEFNSSVLKDNRSHEAETVSN